MKPLIAFATILAALTGGPAQAELYRCENANGEVEYTQTRPKDGQCSEQREALPPSSAPEDNQLMQFSNKLDEQRTEAAETARTEAAAKAKKDAFCKQARDRVAHLEQSGGRQYTIDAQGERQYLSSEAFDRELAGARALVSKECS